MDVNIEVHYAGRETVEQAVSEVVYIYSLDE